MNAPNAAPPLWRNRDYMLLWSGQVVSTLGTTASTVVYPLLILALTGSPQAAGIAGALRSLPYLVLSLPVGALIDRWDRKRVMILCDVGRGLAALSIPIAMAFDVLTLWQIYAATFIEGSLFVFFNIAEVAALPRVVPALQLPQAAAQNEAGFGTANIVGPSLGTFLYQVFGRAVPFLADALSYAVSVLSLLRIKTHFRSDPGVVGTTVHVNRYPFTIVGVAPEQFHGSMAGLAFDIWAPATMFGQLTAAGDFYIRDRRTRMFLSLARLKPGVTIQRARA